nr:DUF1207 domain-containing protein [Motiliproteus sediminis]
MAVFALGGAVDVHAAAETVAWQWEFDPNDQPYPAYVADPRRPRMQVAAGLIDSTIAETSAARIVLDAGTRYTLFRAIDPSGNEWSIDMEGGLFTQFDAGNSLDAVGWDGVYGLFGVYDWHDTIALRVGYKHLSAHLGDEYIESTGRKRVGYTRDALAVGVAWTWKQNWQSYVEPSWAFGMGNEKRQQRAALEGGVQYQGGFEHWGRRAAFYGGLHVRSFAETDWEPGVSLQLGYLVKRDASSTDVRLSLEL